MIGKCDAVLDLGGFVTVDAATAVALPAAGAVIRLRTIDMSRSEL